jgi:predicted acylesterase/phospholipase RssA
VLKGLVETLGADQTAYSAVSGVAGGAVNAAILGSYPVGQEADAAERMITYWQNASNSKLYKDWLGGIVEGLTVKGGVYNDALLKTFLATELADIGDMQRYVDVGITNILTGAFDENIASLDSNLQDVIFASFSYPGFFPPAETLGSSFFDGSVIWDLDIFSAVNKCLETHSDTDVVVDVIMTSRKTLKTVDASNFNALQMLFRYLEVARYYGVMDSLLRAQFAYPHINFRYLVSPTADLPSSLYPLVSNFNLNICRTSTKARLTQQ